MKTITKLMAVAAGFGMALYHEQVIKTAVPPVLNLVAEQRDMALLTEGLRQSAEKIYHKVKAAEPNSHNHQIFTHIIGIERWGQNRLKVALGEPLVMDEYNGYRPARERAWDALIDDFVKTRQETIAIAKQIARTSSPPLIPHNTLGDLSVEAWLMYLQLHADGELYKFK